MKKTYLNILMYAAIISNLSMILMPISQAHASAKLNQIESITADVQHAIEVDINSPDSKIAAEDERDQGAISAQIKQSALKETLIEQRWNRKFSKVLPQLEAKILSEIDQYSNDQVNQLLPNAERTLEEKREDLKSSAVANLKNTMLSTAKEIAKAGSLRKFIKTLSTQSSFKKIKSSELFCYAMNALMVLSMISIVVGLVLLFVGPIGLFFIIPGVVGTVSGLIVSVMCTGGIDSGLFFIFER